MRRIKIIVCTMAIAMILCSGIASGENKVRILVVGNGTPISMNFEGLLNAESNEADLYTLEFESPKNAEKAMTKLKNSPNVESAEYDDIVETESITAEGGRTEAGNREHLSWGVERMGFDEYTHSVNATDTTKDILVAVVDSGVEKSHDLLRKKLTGGYDFIEEDENPNDESGHGTAVAGIIADCTSETGHVKIMPIKVMDQKGEGYVSVVGKGMLYASEKGADIINASFGGDHSPYLDRVVERCENNGTKVVTASGNEGMFINGRTTCPAHMPSVITVGAVDSSLKLEKYSNYGQNLDVVAPGGNIRCAALHNSISEESGTSMATPHVSAALALVELHYGELNGTQTDSVIARSCRNLGDQYYYGNGIIDLRNLTGNIEKYRSRISKTTYIYSGKPVAPRVQVMRNNQALFNRRDYTVSYSKNVAVGRATYTVKGTGTYSGQFTGHFNIVPKGTSVRKLKSGKKCMTVSWKKYRAQTSGYQIQYGHKASMKKSTITTIAGNNHTSKKIKNLKKKTRYYVRIRTYKTVGKQRYYSNWSSVKTKKIS